MYSRHVHSARQTQNHWPATCGIDEYLVVLIYAFYAPCRLWRGFVRLLSRGCGSIVCHHCVFTNVLSKGTKVSKACNGCRLGETPGEYIWQIAYQVSPAALETQHQPGRAIGLTRGAKYSTKSSGQSSAAAAPSSGYFEFINKASDMIIGVKLMAGPVDYMWELTRPSFLALGPDESTHAELREGCHEIYLFVLLNNPNSMQAELSKDIIIDTRSVFSSNLISPCARIDKFRDCVVYKISDISGKNVILKYKGRGLVEVRAGSIIGKLASTSMSLGIGGSVSTSIKEEVDHSPIDFSTNVDGRQVEKVFSSLM
jgi:hypothetical protein